MYNFEIIIKNDVYYKEYNINLLSLCIKLW